MPRSLVIEQSYHFKAAPDKVFQALTDSRGLVKWFLSRARVEPKKGGTYSFDWIGGYHMNGKVKQLEEDKAVSFSWHDKLKSGELVETTANFKIARKGDGSILQLRHTGFHDPEHFADCSSRWAYYLTNMKSVLDHRIDLRSKYDW
jgi:uncharacterized protein YndB with AHSA1/START domain